MIIISDFHDYYDTIQSMGQDRSLVYYRKEREESLAVKYDPTVGKIRRKYGELGSYCCRVGHRIHLTIEYYVVGFCYQVYPLFVVVVDDQTNYLEKIKSFCYSLEEVDSVVKENVREKEFEMYQSKKYNNIWISGGRECISKLFLELKSKSYSYIFDENRSPIFVYKQSSISFNTGLKQYEFYRIFDPYTAYQELNMFMSNMAHPNKPIPTVSDEDMLQAKGFDRWSFRKEKKKEK
jgi:hypothetical protein